MAVFQMPFYFTQEETLEDKKKKWMSEHAHEPKQITPDFEPVPGWKPFAEYGSSPAEIIANCVKKKDFSVLHAGDYFDGTVDGLIYRWTISKFNHYGQNEALMVPNRLIPGKTKFGGNNTYSDSDLGDKFSDFYGQMPASLQPYVLEMSLPWTDSDGEQNTVTAHVFPPSEIEAFGFAEYSKESSSDYKQWQRFNKRSTGAYWLRSTKADDTDMVVVNNDGSPASEFAADAYFMFPCFCIGGGEMSKPTPPKPEPDPGDGDWI